MKGAKAAKKKRTREIWKVVHWALNNTLCELWARERRKGRKNLLLMFTMCHAMPRFCEPRTGSTRRFSVHRSVHVHIEKSLLKMEFLWSPAYIEYREHYIDSRKYEKWNVSPFFTLERMSMGMLISVNMERISLSYEFNRLSISTVDSSVDNDDEVFLVACNTMVESSLCAHTFAQLLARGLNTRN